MHYKIIIFDLDGTILDTIFDLHNSINFALKKMNRLNITLKQTEEYLGYGIKQLFVQATHNASKIEIEELVRLFKEHYQIHYNTYTKAYEGIEDLFKFIKKLGIKIGVLTNKVENIARNLIETHFPNIMEFVYGDIQGRFKKPNPSFLLELLKKLDISLDEVLYIGDSEVDVNFCKNATIEGLFVSYGYRRKESLLQYTNFIVDSPKEIINFLGEKYGY